MRPGSAAASRVPLIENAELENRVVGLDQFSEFHHRRLMGADRRKQPRARQQHGGLGLDCLRQPCQMPLVGLKGLVILPDLVQDPSRAQSLRRVHPTNP